MIYDCFFSYQHEDLPLVEAVAAELEKQGLVCWYAPRDVKGRYAKAITDAIHRSKVFLLILNERSAVSDAVLNEVEIAHNVFKTTKYAVIQPIVTTAMDMNASFAQEMMYYIRRLQFINAENTTCDAIATAIIKQQDELLSPSIQRQESQYVVQKIEDDRLKLQNELFKLFDDEIYRDVFYRYQHPTVFDVGCGTGDMLVPYAKEFACSKFLGVDLNSKQINVAKEKYANDDYLFFPCDVSKQDFEKELIIQKQRLEVDKFDVINISMLLLHLKNPREVLAILKNHLATDGTLIIRDIDDGLNFAYPDEKNAFPRIYKMCDHDEQSGSRRNGRQIYHDLVNAGFTRIKIEKQGLSTAGMDESQRETLFRMYFPFTLENAQIMMKKYPWNKEYQEDYLWFNENYDDIHQTFLQPDFLFSIGVISYTAQP